MVGRRGQCANTVVASWKPTGYSGGKKALAVTCVIYALEESKLGWIKSSSWIQAGSHVLDGDVGVADDYAPRESLGSSIVGGIGIGEGSSD